MNSCVRLLKSSANICTVSILTVHEKKRQDLTSIHSLPYCTTVPCGPSNQSNQLHKKGDFTSHHFQNSTKIAFLIKSLLCHKSCNTQMIPFFCSGWKNIHLLSRAADSQLGSWWWNWTIDLHLQLLHSLDAFGYSPRKLSYILLPAVSVGIVWEHLSNQVSNGMQEAPAFPSLCCWQHCASATTQ